MDKVDRREVKLLEISNRISELKLEIDTCQGIFTNTSSSYSPHIKSRYRRSYEHLKPMLELGCEIYKKLTNG